MPVHILQSFTGMRLKKETATASKFYKSPISSKYILPTVVFVHTGLAVFQNCKVRIRDKIYFLIILVCLIEKNQMSYHRFESLLLTCTIRLLFLLLPIV